MEVSSKTYQYRKVMKPLRERERRARINKCLDQLKDLMIDCLRQDNNDEFVIRLEKADILEHTVDYLKKIKNQDKKVKNDNFNETESFRNGYVCAANEVSKIMASTRGIDISLGTHLMKHLGYKLNDLQQQKENIDLITSDQQIEFNRYEDNYYNQLNIDILPNSRVYVENQSSFSPVSSGYFSESDNRSCSSRMSSEINYFTMCTANTSDQVGQEFIWRPW